MCLTVLVKISQSQDLQFPPERKEYFFVKSRIPEEAFARIRLKPNYFKKQSFLSSFWSRFFSASVHNSSNSELYIEKAPLHIGVIVHQIKNT